MTLFVVQAAGADAAALEEARVVKEGFSWPAFVFAWIWLLYHRLWLPLLIWAVLEIGFFVLLAPHLASGTSMLVDGLAHLFIGFEGNRLRLRRDAALNDVVEARDTDEAATIFFRRVLGEAPR